MLEENALIGIVTEHDIFQILMKNRDLIISVLDRNSLFLKNRYMKIFPISGLPHLSSNDIFVIDYNNSHKIIEMKI